MPLRPKEVEVVRIELTTPGEWVDVKKTLSVSDRLRAYDMAKISGGELSDVDLERATFALFEVGLVRWSFDEPLCAETVRRLDDSDFQAIKDGCDGLWPKARTDDDRKN
jgi:hypothetical protein